ncbi:MAG: hypothetical protein DRR19_05225 [Candidatus Parabeggiatoa sp. nov. 1]|nr:MAG: hypothetical protein DRR19_05225 [Gammaproteobacteria bacterium]
MTFFKFTKSRDSFAVVFHLLCMVVLLLMSSASHSKNREEIAKRTPFLDMLNVANRIVQKYYPQGAQFYEADFDAVKRNTWQFVFNYPPCRGEKSHSTILLRMTRRGTFQLPTQVCEPLTGKAIPLPLNLSLKEARKLAKEAGCGGEWEEFRHIQLRWPAEPAEEAHYLFTMKRGQALVGVNSKQVRCVN